MILKDQKLFLKDALSDIENSIKEKELDQAIGLIDDYRKFKIIFDQSMTLVEAYEKEVQGLIKAQAEEALNKQAEAEAKAKAEADAKAAKVAEIKAQIRAEIEPEIRAQILAEIQAERKLDNQEVVKLPPLEDIDILLKEPSEDTKPKAKKENKSKTAVSKLGEFADRFLK